MIAPALSEAAWQSRVLDLAQHHRWRRHHARPALRQSGGYSTPIQGEVGFPDLVLCGHGRLLLVELKSERGRVRPEQTEWLDALAAVDGVEVYCWRPSHWGVVQDILRPAWRDGP